MTPFKTLRHLPLKKKSFLSRKYFFPIFPVTFSRCLREKNPFLETSVSKTLDMLPNAILACVLSLLDIWMFWTPDSLFKNEIDKGSPKYVKSKLKKYFKNSSHHTMAVTVTEVTSVQNLLRFKKCKDILDVATCLRKWERLCVKKRLHEIGKKCEATLS